MVGRHKTRPACLVARHGNLAYPELAWLQATLGANSDQTSQVADGWHRRPVATRLRKLLAVFLPRKREDKMLKDAKRTNTWIHKSMDEKSKSRHVCWLKIHHFFSVPYLICSTSVSIMGLSSALKPSKITSWGFPATSLLHKLWLGWHWCW